MPRYEVHYHLDACCSIIVDAANEDEIRKLAKAEDEFYLDPSNVETRTHKWETEIDDIEKLDDDAKG